MSAWSKDPSTQCGAVIVDPKGRIVATGYNGFARGVEDRHDRLHDREEKYRLVVHAEINAILTAGRDLAGCTLYTHPFPTCERCAAQVIQSGISRVVSRFSDNPRWKDSFRLAGQQYLEAGVVWDVYPATEDSPVGFRARGWTVYPTLPAAVDAVPDTIIPGRGRSEL